MKKIKSKFNSFKDIIARQLYSQLWSNMVFLTTIKVDKMDIEKQAKQTQIILTPFQKYWQGEIDWTEFRSLDPATAWKIEVGIGITLGFVIAVGLYLYMHGSDGSDGSSTSNIVNTNRTVSTNEESNSAYIAIRQFQQDNQRHLEALEININNTRTNVTNWNAQMAEATANLDIARAEVRREFVNLMAAVHQQQFRNYVIASTTRDSTGRLPSPPIIDLDSLASPPDPAVIEFIINYIFK